MNSAQDNLVVEVVFYIDKNSDGYPKSRDAEALLCKPSNADCSVCTVTSVPFYLRNVAYGDVISTKEGPSNSLQFNSVVSRGGYSIYRILLRDEGKKDELIKKLLDFDALVEQDGNLVAFAVPPAVNRDAIVDYVLEGKQEGFWAAQDGYVPE